MPARRFADLAVPLTVSVTDLDTGELLLFGDGRRGRAAGRRALRHLRAAGVLSRPCVSDGRRCGDGGLRGPLPLEAAAPARAGARGRGGRRPGFRHSPGRRARRCPAAGARPRRGGRHPDGGQRPRPSSRSGGATPARPPLVYVRPQVERERDLPGGPDAAVRRGRLPRRRARRSPLGLDPHLSAAN